jgi:tetratricopeptide (TPR) repeat protein
MNFARKPATLSARTARATFILIALAPHPLPVQRRRRLDSHPCGAEHPAFCKQSDIVMFPKLTPLQWLIAAGFLFFYGFAVFALTRDYYLRYPPQPVAVAPAAPHGIPSQATADLGARMRDALGADSNIPPELMDADPVLLGQEADRLFAAQRFAAAVPLYQRLLELTPEDPEVKNDLGLALHYAGSPADALAVIDEGVRQAPDFQRIRLTQGFVAAQTGRIGLARDALTAARDLDPDSDVGIEAARLLQTLPPPATDSDR